ncbi:hypothetical protein [Roseimaritima ulvae]|uniref:Uncharacterized protein n=1 Tax=Roseimaritima ulvae TaxID=980254 RepID=A0A5B9R6B6_9BACT|nr:hypothetical protein [Roseimaritima ulvae]QEG42071.1 hypothetical protein UC8_41010 [Roseimaritima ulvae]
MSSSDNNKVTRYCPECKSRISAAQSIFEQPQICPKCKTRVYFIDYLEIRPQLSPELSEFVKHGSPLTRPIVQVIVVAAAIVLVLGFLAAVISGVPLGLFILASLMMALGLAGVAFWLDYASKTRELIAAYEALARRAENLHGRQTSLVQHVHGFQ